jgi:hypothetical protein
LKYGNLRNVVNADFSVMAGGKKLVQIKTANIRFLPFTTRMETERRVVKNTGGSFYSAPCLVIILSLYPLASGMTEEKRDILFLYFYAATAPNVAL